MRSNYLSIIWRLNIGSFAIATTAIPFVAVSAYIAAKYSLRRTIGDPKGIVTPIWKFRTQQLPVLHALAQVYVMKAYSKEMSFLYKDTTLDYRSRMGVSTALKVVIMCSTLKTLSSLEDRCGAQGLYAHNQIITKEVSPYESSSLTSTNDYFTSLRLEAFPLLKGMFWC